MPWFAAKPQPRPGILPTPPADLVVPIANVRTLELGIEGDARVDLGSSVTWADARLEKYPAEFCQPYEWLE